MAKSKHDPTKPASAWDCARMRFPEVLSAPGALTNRYPVLAVLPDTDKVSDTLLRYVILRCGKASPFYNLGEVGERKRHILLALNAQPDDVLRVAADKDGVVKRLCVVYLRMFEHSADLALLLALEEKNQQDLIRIQAPIKVVNATTGADADDAEMRAYVSRTQLSAMMRQQAKDIQDLRALVFQGDEDLATAVTTEDTGASFSERYAQRPEFKGQAE